MISEMQSWTCIRCAYLLAHRLHRLCVQVFLHVCGVCVCSVFHISAEGVADSSVTIAAAIVLLLILQQHKHHDSNSVVGDFLRICGAGGLADDWATSDAGASRQPASSLPLFFFNGVQDQCDMLGHGDHQSPCWCACVGGLVVLVLLCVVY